MLTINKLAVASLEAVKNDPLFEKAVAHCPLEYTTPDRSTEDLGSTGYVVGSVCYGTNEGIVGYVTFIKGKQAKHLITFKTLNMDKAAYANMGFITALYCHHASEIFVKSWFEGGNTK